MNRKKLKALLIRMLHLYTLQVTLITVLLIVLGKLLDRDRVFSYEAFLSPLFYALIGTAAALISLLLIEAAVIFIALRVDTIPTDRSWVLPGIMIGILVVFLLVNLIQYFSDKREAQKLSMDLARYQQQHKMQA